MKATMNESELILTVCLLGNSIRIQLRVYVYFIFDCNYFMGTYFLLYYSWCKYRIKTNIRWSKRPETVFI